jgi:Domain of unknown function (DUF4153)
MNTRTRTGFEVLQFALVLGLLGDILLRATPWGLNVLLFNTAFAAGMITLLYRRAPEILTKQTMALFGALVFFAAMFAWRDATELLVADTFAIITILSILFLPKLQVTTQLAGVFHYVIAFFWSALNAFFAPVALLISDIEWKSLQRAGWSRHLFAVLRAVIIVTPILLIFGALFIAADAAYEGWVQRVFNIKPETVLTHVLLFSFFSWMSAGYLRGAVTKQDIVEMGTQTAPENEAAAETVLDPSTALNHLSILEHINISDPPNASEEAKPADTPVAEKKKFAWSDLENSVLPAAFTLGTVEVGVIIGLMNLLFLSFVLVQLPYLFGGMDLVQSTPDFKLAEYARRGFGELVTVSALVLPILLATHWLLRKESRTTEWLFRIFAGIQIALLFVIMASAVQRLVLLTGNLGYGLTTIRLYPLIFMSWLAIVFIWFGATVLRGYRNYFAWGALWSAFLILGATHVLNPDAFIVKTNLRLMQEGRMFDAVYNSNLSDDGLPALMESFTNLDPSDQKVVARQIARRYCEMRTDDDLRSWKFDSAVLWQKIDSNRELVNEIGGCDSGFLYSPVYRD